MIKKLRYISKESSKPIKAPAPNMFFVLNKPKTVEFLCFKGDNFC